WRLHAADAGQRALAAALLDGWRTAAAEQCPHAAARIDAWHARRQLALALESTRIEVGHFDLYAEPGVEI
ncbi:MAG: class I SAM-dependent methyltransferase, partial [Pseudomonadota bacterium]